MNEGQAHERVCGRRPVRYVDRGEDARTVWRPDSKPVANGTPPGARPVVERTPPGESGHVTRRAPTPAPARSGQPGRARQVAVDLAGRLAAFVDGVDHQGLAAAAPERM